MPNLQCATDLFADPRNRQLLAGIRRGIEKESLRVNAAGNLAQTPHPRALGSALTHPRITTDFSEALLELITPPSQSTEEVLGTLRHLHAYVNNHLDDELLWVHSMPCVLPGDDAIPVARYGDSNIGRMKTIYRLGLGHRYGRLMQTISGVHYNWSLPDQVWSLLQTASRNHGDFQAYKTERYFDLIRNFRRRTWLLLYLFGAAPAVCPSFVAGRRHHLVPFNDRTDTLCAPLGTSLRMGDLGYQSDAQSSLVVCYNDLDTYIDTLRQGLSQPYPPYAATGIKDDNGEYRQLSTHLLQIENEFYSTIRPKRTTRPGETPLKALQERGVEYIEVRCLDLNPFAYEGIDAQQIHFLDIFLLHCLLSDSPETDEEENRHLRENQLATVYRGRDPELVLKRQGEAVSARQWGAELMAAMAPVARLLDRAHVTQRYSEALAVMTRRLEHPEETPSARILAALEREDLSYFQLALRHAREHRDYFRQHPLSETEEMRYQEMAEVSLHHRRELEESPQPPFEEFLRDYFNQHGH